MPKKKEETKAKVVVKKDVDVEKTPKVLVDKDAIIE